MAVLRTPLVPSTLSTYRSRLDEWSIDADCTSSWGPRACTSHVFVQDIRRHLLMGSSASPPSSSSQPAHPRSSLLATSAPVMSDVDATTPAQYTPYLQFRNITVVTCGAGPYDEPLTYHGACAFVIENIATRWLLIEFSLDDSTSSLFPFPTTSLDPGIEGLLFELPPTFNFEYFAEHNAARWISREPSKRLFSLVFSFKTDYREMWAAMSASQGRGVTTNTAFMTVGGTPTLTQMVQQRLFGTDTV
ncbi:hypothetical protein C8T65DRAFT_644050 [Cerioporus squamosus]|nr:hypothetical protein C8T65DRAFT_644050 [Cerioporus squamosus]